MSIHNRALYFRALRAFGGLLVVVFGVLYFVCGLHAYGWRYGEPVQVTVPDSCEYLVDTGELVDCQGAWTTSDGVQHYGEIDASISSFPTSSETVQLRAWGDSSVYDEPDRWTNILGIASPFAVGAGLVTLVLAFLVRPGKGVWARARSRPLATELVTLARDRDLGRERTRYWAKASIKHGVFVFDNGCVVSVSDREPSVVRWDQVVLVFEHAYRDELTVRRLYLACLDDNSSVSFDEAHFDNVHGLGATVIESVNRRLLPIILAILQRGGTYRFPVPGTENDIYLSPTGVGCREGEVSWSDLTGVEVKDGRLLIHGEQTIRCPWGTVGNASMLLAILRSVLADSVRLTKRVNDA